MSFKKNKQIVFLESYPTVMVYKIAKIFKEKGYEVVSIRLLKNDEKSDKFYEDAFDKIISFNLGPMKVKFNEIYLVLRRIRDILKAILQISKINALVIIGRAKPSFPIAIVKKIFRKYPLVYFPYDIRAFDEDKELEGVSRFEIKSEKFCFENADGIIHKGNENELKILNKSRLGKDIKINSNVINFLPYCSKEFIIPPNKEKLSKKDKEIHMVHIGCMGSIGNDHFSVEHCKKLAKEKIHIHLYSTSEIAPELIKEELDSGYFHFHKLLDPKQIIKEISKYDFGLCLLPKITEEDLEKKSDTGNKTASYLEAGIPIISISYENKKIFITEFIKKYNIGFSLELKDIANFKKKKIKYKELEKNVIRAREDFLMENHFNELEEFMKKVIENK